MVVAGGRCGRPVSVGGAELTQARRCSKAAPVVAVVSDELMDIHRRSPWEAPTPPQILRRDPTSEQRSIIKVIIFFSRSFSWLPTTNNAAITTAAAVDDET